MSNYKIGSIVPLSDDSKDARMAVALKEMAALTAERDQLAADNARMREALGKIRDRALPLGMDRGDSVTMLIAEESLAATPAQSLAAHDASLLREVAKKHAYRRQDGDWTIHPDSLTDEADRIERDGGAKEVA